ncbi:hypothetical protein OA413_04060 [Pelagibacteraceae bacterium]|nr:hypothetical protein [Pelagibacteraceae bacterium]
MRKTHYINPRHYQNQKTILLNPSKPFSRHGVPSRKSGLFKYILFVFLLFSIFIGYSAYAGGREDEGWVTEIDSDGVTIRHHGNIIHGDDIFLFLSKNDCNSASWISRIYTMAQNDFEPLVNKLLPYKLQSYSNKLDYGYTTGQLISVRPFLRGHSALVFFGKYPLDRYLQWFRSGDEYYFEIVKADSNLIEREYDSNEEVLMIEPTDYFDIQMNAYYFKGFNKALVYAQKKCIDLGVVAKV